ncbi:MAG: 30S ribosomal protein S7 [bacterium]|nr:30S ribosomal protein S7 [bacterium]
MARKAIKKKSLAPDSVYSDSLVTKLINHVMKDGKKSAARKIVYGSFDILKEKMKEEPLGVYLRAMENVGPLQEVRSRRVGGATYQVPVEVRGDRRQSLALRWIIGSARNKKGRPMREKLAEEIMAAAKNEGVAVKKKEDAHRMADANRAFAHLAW